MQQKTVAGVGINDVAEPVKGNKLYGVWRSMLTRCYSDVPDIYVGCSVVPEWHKFSAFKSWMEANNHEGLHLDKDLKVPGNKVYGPETCLLVPHEVNTLLNSQPKLGGQYPVGVGYVAPLRRYKAVMRARKKTVHLGMFNTAEEAGKAYLLAKAKYVAEIAASQLRPEVRTALLNASNALKESAL